MFKGSAKPSSLYKEYISPDTSIKPTERIPNKIYALDQVVGTIYSADQQVEAIQVVVGDDKLLLALLHDGSRSVMIRHASKAVNMFATQLDLLLKQCYRHLSLKQETAGPVVIQLANAAALLNQLIDDIATYPPTAEKRKQKLFQHVRSRTLSMVKSISVLKSVFGEYRAELMLEKRAAEAKDIDIPIRKAKPTALFNEDTDINLVLKGFQKKGWRVDLRQNDAAVGQPEDGFDLSLALLERIRKPAVQLLQQNSAIGVVRFPAILRVRNKLSDSMIQKCVDPSVGYNLYLIFGGYIAVDNILMLGVSENLLRVYDKAGRATLRIDKFGEMLPRAIKEAPQYEEQLSRVRPVLPARLNGSHYYALLMPKGTMGESRHAISDWGFITA